MTDFLEHWTHQSDANAKLVAQERFITEVTEAIWKAMEEAGISKTDLANRMGATKGHVSQVLSGSRNMTLRTLADICFALDLKPTFGMGVKLGVATVERRWTHRYPADSHPDVPASAVESQ